MGLKYGTLNFNCFYPKYFNLREQLFKILIRHVHHLMIGQHQTYLSGLELENTCLCGEKLTLILLLLLSLLPSVLYILHYRFSIKRLKVTPTSLKSNKRQ